MVSPTSQVLREEEPGCFTESSSNDPLLREISSYWDQHLHDREIATQPVGSQEFFKELEAYRFEKLSYLSQILDSPSYQGARLLEVGCGVGLDLVRLAKTGAFVCGIDLSEVAIELARRHFAQQGLTADLSVMNGEQMDFQDNSFDVVYANSVLHYTARPSRMIAEVFRVLRPGGQAIMMVYNKNSWLTAASKLTGVTLQHQAAPVQLLYSSGEFRRLLSQFSEVRIAAERFPVRTRLHSGWKASLYNFGFVRLFRLLPRRLKRPYGFHLWAFASK